jgi:hypothetical protein
VLCVTGRHAAQVLGLRNQRTHKPNQMERLKSRHRSRGLRYPRVAEIHFDNDQLVPLLEERVEPVEEVFGVVRRVHDPDALLDLACMGRLQFREQFVVDAGRCAVKVVSDYVARWCVGASDPGPATSRCLRASRRRWRSMPRGSWPTTTRRSRRGPLEGTNNKIQLMKRQAYGFRDLDFFRLKILGIHETRHALVG